MQKTYDKYPQEFKQALKKAEEINDREFKGELESLYEVFESQNNLKFRFTFKKETDGTGFDNKPVVEQNKIITSSSINLFVGIVNAKHTYNDDRTVLKVDVVVVKPGTYDNFMISNEKQQRAELLRRLRGGNHGIK